MAQEAQPSDRVVGWIEAARAGSAEALGRLLEACRPYLLLVANHQLNADLRAKVGASDVVQETFLEAQRDFSGFHGHTEEEILAWLSRILLHNLANVTRQYREAGKRLVAREVPLADVPSGELHNELVDAVSSPSSRAMARERNEELERVLGQLPEHYRTVIRLRHQDRLSFEEIGRQTGCSAEAARKQWVRGLERLRRLLEAGHRPD